MVNVYTKPGSQPVDLGFKNNTAVVLEAGLDPCEAGIETNTGLWAFKDHAGTYRRCAPRSSLSAFFVPVCSNSTTGELTDSLIASLATGVLINGGELDRDFRVGGDGQAYGLCYDGGLDRLGIGEGSPLYKVHITDPNPVLALEDSDTGARALISAASGTGSLSIDADLFGAAANTKLVLGVDGDPCLEIDAAGDVLVAKGDLVIPDGKGIYFCATTNDKSSVGTLRMVRSGTDIVTERWNGSIWES